MKFSKSSEYVPIWSALLGPDYESFLPIPVFWLPDIFLLDTCWSLQTKHSKINRLVRNMKWIIWSVKMEVIAQMKDLKKKKDFLQETHGKSSDTTPIIPVVFLYCTMYQL